MMPMIWFLVSMFFVSGHPVGEATYNQKSWHTEKECQDFMASDEGKKNLAALTAAINKAAKGVKVEVRTACIPREDRSL